MSCYDQCNVAQRCVKFWNLALKRPGSVHLHFLGIQLPCIKGQPGLLYDPQMNESRDSNISWYRDKPLPPILAEIAVLWANAWCCLKSLYFRMAHCTITGNWNLEKVSTSAKACSTETLCFELSAGDVTGECNISSHISLRVALKASGVCSVLFSSFLFFPHICMVPGNGHTESWIPNGICTKLVVPRVKMVVGWTNQDDEEAFFFFLRESIFFVSLSWILKLSAGALGTQSPWSWLTDL